jgi:cytochrome c-type biogenesis protein CcmE
VAFGLKGREPGKATEQEAMMKIKPIYIVGFVVIAAALLFGASAFAGSLTPYVGVAEAKAAKGTVQVYGLVENGKSSLDQRGNFTFVLVDDKQNRMQVMYKGVKPGNFDQAIGVVAVGRTNGDVFEASQLLVKCPSKYEAQYGPTKVPGQ